MANNTKHIGNKITGIIYYLFFLALAVAAMFYCFKNFKIEDLTDQLKSANYFFIGLSLLLGVLSYLLRSLRWQILIKPLGYKPSLFNVYNAVMTGYLANLVIPRIGEVTRCAVLNKTDKIPGDSLFGTVIIERIIDLISLIIVALIVFFLRMDFFGRFISERITPVFNDSVSGIPALYLIILAVSAVCVCLLIILFRKKIARWAIVRKITSLLSGTFKGLKTIFKMKNYILFILYTVGIWVCFWLMSYYTMEALPATSALSPADGLFLMVLGSLGWVVPVPGGMGSFHLFVTWGLAMYGIPFEEGRVFATISHESQVIIMIVLGLISLVSISVASKHVAQAQKPA